jgi:PAS domain S-box-containing protein
LSEVSPDGRFLRVKDELCRILGRPREELLRLGILDVTLAADVPPSLLAIGQALATGGPVSLGKRYLRPDSSLVWANSSLTRLFQAQGQPETLLAITVDLTARHQAEAALRESEARLRVALDAGRMAVWQSDTRTNIITSSPELNLLLGFPADASPTTEDIRLRYPPGARESLRAAAAAALERGERYAEAELEVIWPDGSNHWLLVRAELEVTPVPGSTPQIKATGDCLRHHGAQALGGAPAAADQRAEPPGEEYPRHGAGYGGPEPAATRGRKPPEASTLRGSAVRPGTGSRRADPCALSFARGVSNALCRSCRILVDLPKNRATKPISWSIGRASQS